MSWNKKARVIAIFSMGLFACIASVLRLVYQLELTHIGFNTPTYQLDIDRIGLWACVIYRPMSAFSKLISV